MCPAWSQTKPLPAPFDTPTVKKLVGSRRSVLMYATDGAVDSKSFTTDCSPARSGPRAATERGSMGAGRCADRVVAAASVMAMEAAMSPVRRAVMGEWKRSGPTLEIVVQTAGFNPPRIDSALNLFRYNPSRSDQDR